MLFGVLFTKFSTPYNRYTVIENYLHQKGVSMTRFETISAITMAIAIIPATWVPLHIFRTNQVSAAALEFSSAFQIVIQELKAGLSATLVLAEEYPKHEHAMRKFVPHLSRSTRRNFSAAWQSYEDHCTTLTNDEAFIPHMEAIYSQVSIDTDLINIRTLDLIENLLVFCKPRKWQWQ